MIHQRTLSQTISASGVGLHSGERVKLTLRPAPPDTGIIFRRTDLTPPVELRAEPALVNDTRLSSTLVDPNGVRVATVEHLMSALAGLGIDNLIVEMTGPETPIMDGSAAPFIYLLDSAGISEQTALKRYIRVLKPLEVVEGDKWVKLTPYDGFTVSLEIEFNHPVFRRTPQHLTIDFAAQSYIDEVSRARTFGFMHEVEYMRMNGLGLGGNLDNAIVIDDDSVLNKDGLPDIRTVRVGRPAAGRGWLGLTPRGAYRTPDTHQTPLLPDALMLVLAAGLMLAAWLVEGRRRPPRDGASA